MNIVIWNIQFLLAITILVPAFKMISFDTFTLKRSNGGRMDWVEEFRPFCLKIIGVFKILIGMGLLLPSLLNYNSWLTPISAIGVSLIMMLILSFHVKRKENIRRIATNIGISCLALFVAYSRLFILPI